jgi:hypothetical protein
MAESPSVGNALQRSEKACKNSFVAALSAGASGAEVGENQICEPNERLFTFRQTFSLLLPEESASTRHTTVAL